jgi:hypothetical protein
MADALELRIADARHDPLETEGTADETGDDIGLVAVGKAIEDVGVRGIDFAQDVRLAAITLQEAAVHLFGPFIDLGLVGLDVILDAVVVEHGVVHIK